MERSHITIGRLPDFIGVGPPRTATTWLHEVLSGHVGLPSGVKETEFFLRYYDNGIEWYLDLFRNCRRDQPVGELCPTYFASPEARQRIAREVPNCKIIVTLRDPVARLYSHYQLLRREAWIRKDVTLEQAIERHLRTASGPGNLFDLSRYAFHLRAWQQTFGTEKVLVLFQDDLDKDAQKFIATVCAFIGIPEIDLGESRVGHKRLNSIARAPRNATLAKAVRSAIFRLRAHKHYGLINFWDRTWLWKLVFEGGEEFQPPDPSTEARLREHFRHEIEALEILTGRDLSRWKPSAQGSAHL
jgi:Sulfotransferase domain